MIKVPKIGMIVLGTLVAVGISVSAWLIFHDTAGSLRSSVDLDPMGYWSSVETEQQHERLELTISPEFVTIRHGTAAPKAYSYSMEQGDRNVSQFRMTTSDDILGMSFYLRASPASVWLVSDGARLQVQRRTTGE